jgi:eukaryotic-like serine/threonine-protein kinase
MGFLMDRFTLIVPAFCALLLISACSSFKLKEPIPVRYDDWLEAGGSPAREHRTESALSTPFVPAWEFNAGAGFPRNAMLRAGERLFVSTLNGEIHIINIHTGDKIGRLQFGSPIAGSPLIYRNILYVPLSAGDKTLVAYHLLTGKEIWSKRIGPVETSPLQLNGLIFITARNGTLYALDPMSGDERWTQDVSERLYASPAGGDGAVYVGNPRGTLTAFNADDGSVVWETAGLGTMLTQPVLDDRHVYVTTRDSMVYSLDRKSGAIRWKQKKDGKFYAAPALGKEYIVVATAGGSILALDKETGEDRWEYRAQRIINAEPLTAGSHVAVVSLDKSVYVIREADGLLQWSFSTDSRLKTTPLVWDRYLLVCSEDRVVYAFVAERP